MPTELENVCPLCGRELAGLCNRHHLVPLSKGGKNTPTILLHKICHDKIHAVFSEMELKRHYATIALIKEHEEIQKFIRWVAKKEPEFYDKSVKRKK
ncbi:HNH endonuclease [Segetibacter sp. 3557_3]|nr:HNH endonuclease [Segetibacter sp. 3557_3]